ncbi:hypothetical protein MP228_001189 [Amoeboaphelidium protococcarum]|nr:hypothetical protein MP228_001189 [Amoeboaphelidium protococcarum]
MSSQQQQQQQQQSPEDGTWKFAQCFGDKGDVEDVTEPDIISAVEFDHTGNYLATGDKGGRVVLFERNTQKKGCEYKFYTEFQSHEPEFDYLKSVEIEEKINKIKWLKQHGNNNLLLSTNDKTIKLWKVYEKTVKSLVEGNINAMDTENTSAPNGILKLPKVLISDAFVAAQPKKIYANAHTYHINSISVNSDQETFLSADDLRINLWNFAVNDQSFNIVDIKPVNMEELTEVITAAEFHPLLCNQFVYSSSKGTIKLADMRQQALCDRHAKCYEEDEDPANKSFFTEILSSVNDVRFSPDGRYLLSRDYLTLKLWDVNMENKPVKKINVHDYVNSKLAELYEQEILFDKFECNWSGDGKYMLTGSYGNYFNIYDRGSKNEVSLQADKSAFKAKRSNTAKTKLGLGKSTKSLSSGSTGGGLSKKEEINPDTVDFSKKILHSSWHPKENSVAVAATNNLFLFSTL